ncbi:hypothetical protein HYW32_03095 [Candidatus Berkelbacteria bacterium]|nr:hypothetical protein [Candidatus Berkelbacteria bacterium]
MGHTIPLTTNGKYTEGVRKRTLERTVQLGPVSLRILTIASLASLLLFYLAQTTQSATRSYEVQALEQKKQELLDEVERLDLESQRLQSLGSIQQGLGDELKKDFETAGELKVVE